MQAYCVETTLMQDHTLTLQNLPFRKGELVEIIVLRQPMVSAQPSPRALRGTLLSYLSPTEPVAQEDWEVLQ